MVEWLLTGFIQYMTFAAVGGITLAALVLGLRGLAS